VFGNSRLPNPKQIQPPLEDVPKGRLCQLLEESLADLCEEYRDLILIILLLETGIIKKNKLGSPREGRQVAVVIPRLLPLPIAFPINFST